MKPVNSEQLTVNSEQSSVNSEQGSVNSVQSSVSSGLRKDESQSFTHGTQPSVFNLQSSIFNRRGGMWVLAFLLALTLFVPASKLLAQTYWFQVPELRMQVFVNPDASARIVYDITFDNSGSPIDIVDIGTPHDGYAISNFTSI